MSVALSSPTPRKQRIIEIASEIVATKVERGELDPNDEGAMDAACRGGRPRCKDALRCCR